MNGINEGFSFAPMDYLKGLIFGILMVLLANCNPENSRNQPEKTAALQDPAIDFLTESIRKYPDSIAIYQALVDTLANSGKYAEAAAWCNQAMAADSINTNSWLLVKGDLYRLGKYYDSAITTYQYYLSRFPEQEQILLNLAGTYAEKGDSNCLPLCNQIASRYPSPDTKAKTAFIAGLYFNVSHQYSEARKWLDSAITLRYTFSEAWMERGYSFYDEKKFTDAQKTFRQLTEINKGNADAWYWLGKSAEAAGNKAEAVSSYNRAFSLDRNLSEAQAAVSRLTGK